MKKKDVLIRIEKFFESSPGDSENLEGDEIDSFLNELIEIDR